MTVSKNTLEENIEGVRLIELNNDPFLLFEAKTLLGEYGDYIYNDLQLIAGRESFFKQLEQFPGADYCPPLGTFIIAEAGGVLAGCAGIKRFDEDCCEMKRNYIRTAFRGRGISTLMCGFLIEWCRKSNYSRILLDTNREMKVALALYHKCGFKEIAPYCLNENKHPVFMELIL